MQETPAAVGYDAMTLPFFEASFGCHFRSKTRFLAFLLPLLRLLYFFVLDAEVCSTKPFNGFLFVPGLSIGDVSIDEVNRR